MKIAKYLKECQFKNCFVAMDGNGQWWQYDFRPLKNKVERKWYVRFGFQSPLPAEIEPVAHWDKSLRLIGEEQKVYAYSQLDKLQEVKRKIMDCSGNKVVFANGEVWEVFDSSRLYRRIVR